MTTTENLRQNFPDPQDLFGEIDRVERLAGQPKFRRLAAARLVLLQREVALRKLTSWQLLRDQNRG